jgi:hypothetical protein
MNVSKLINEAYKISRLLQLDESLLTEAELQLVVENRVEFLKKNNPTLDTSHDPHGQHKDANNIIDHLATHADPTKNKSHTQWLVGQYKKKNIRQEDAGRAHAALSGFEKYKGKLANKDINSYKKVSDVEDAVAPHEGTHASKKEETKAIKHEGADLKYEDEHVKIHHIKTEEAAKHYGKGTKWCTAADKDNMFSHYHKDGPIHVITHKTEKDSEGRPRKFQFHAASNQFMDEKDNEISHEDFNKIKPSFHKAIDAHPEMVE